MVPVKIPFQMDLYSFQKSNNYNHHIHNQRGVSKISVIHFQNNSR